MAARRDLLVLAAFQPEIARLQESLAKAPNGAVGSTLVEARVVGIGLPMAAAGAAMLLAELQPSAVLLLGTCGAYAGSGLSIGEVVVARRIRLVEPSALDGHSEFPQPMSLVSDAHESMLVSIAHSTGARRADVASTLAITVDDATACRIAKATGADVEHLEAYGVATACAALDVPFAAVLGVANFVGSHARDEWRAHHRTAEWHATDAVLGWLTSGGSLPA